MFVSAWELLGGSLWYFILENFMKCCYAIAVSIKTGHFLTATLCENIHVSGYVSVCNPSVDMCSSCHALETHVR